MAFEAKVHHLDTEMVCSFAWIQRMSVWLRFTPQAPLLVDTFVDCGITTTSAFRCKMADSFLISNAHGKIGAARLFCCF
jgi:hypothetical protein